METACDYFYLFGCCEPKLNEIGVGFFVLSICVRQVSPEFMQLIFCSPPHITIDQLIIHCTLPLQLSESNATSNYFQTAEIVFFLLKIKWNCWIETYAECFTSAVHLIGANPAHIDLLSRYNR